VLSRTKSGWFLIGELRSETTGLCLLGLERRTSGAKAVERPSMYGTAEAVPYV